MMLKLIRYCILALLTGVAVLFAGCHSDAPVAPDAEGPDMSGPDPAKVTLCLNVSIDGQENTTRADLTDQDGYENASGNFEKIKTLRVIIVRDLPDDKTWGVIEANRLVSTHDNGNPINDNLEFRVRANESKRIYLVANERYLTYISDKYNTASEFLSSFKVDKDNPSKVDLTPLEEWTVSLRDVTEISIDGVDKEATTEGLFAPTELDPEPLLPLTEFFDIYVDREKAIDEICYSNLFMTRAAAKVSFYIDDTDTSAAYEKVKITAITLSGIGSKEYVFPNGAKYSKGKYQDTSTPDLNMYITDFNTPADCKALTYLMQDLEIPVVDDTSSEKERKISDVSIYFPESILSTSDERYEVGVRLSTGVWLTAPLVDNILNIKGKEAVARNTHLKIILKFTSPEMTAEVSVVPYIGIELKPGFGFDGLLPGDHSQPTDW